MKGLNVEQIKLASNKPTRAFKPTSDIATIPGALLTESMESFIMAQCVSKSYIRETMVSPTSGYGNVGLKIKADELV